MVSESQSQIASPETAAEDQQRLLSMRWRRHREVLVVCVLVVVLAFLLRVREGQKVEVSVGSGWTVPELCISRSMLGFQCPGCGLTRSFVCLAAGDVAGSIAYHRVGWLLALATLIQIPYRSFMLYWLSRRGLPEPIPSIANQLFGWTLIAALIGSWGLGLVGI